MKNTLIFFILIIVSDFKATGQRSVSDTSFNNSKCFNAIYLEFGGNARAVSLNYERKLLHKNYFSFYGRLGFGLDIFKFSQGNMLVPSIPIELSTSIGKRKYFAEIGIGGTPFWSKTETWSSNVYYYDLNIDSLDYKFYILFIPRIGYRYQSNKGWLMRLAFTPILYNSSNNNNNNKYLTYYGISVGKIF